jgi:hypothetical protein
MAYSCTKPDCTVAVTRKCLLLHEPCETCPNYEATESPGTDGGAPENHGEAPTGQEHCVARRFFPGFELGTDNATEIMRGNYGTLIAILGPYDVGKTCFLSSLYLMTGARAIGPDLAFAGSLTLNGFEARARRLREWKKGALPKQLADHTILSDDRAASLMHLALRERSDTCRRFDLLVTDLPGEWSTDLVKDAGTADRFHFLKRADAIVVALDGPLLLGHERHAAVHDAKMLLTRLSDTVQVDRSIPLILMVTKCDQLGMKAPPAVATIASHAKSAGFDPKVILIAAVSRSPQDVKSGTGVMDVIEHVLDRKREPQPRPIKPDRKVSSRNFARIRG